MGCAHNRNRDSSQSDIETLLHIAHVLEEHIPIGLAIYHPQFSTDFDSELDQILSFYKANELHQKQCKLSFPYLKSQLHNATHQMIKKTTTFNFFATLTPKTNMHDADSVVEPSIVTKNIAVIEIPHGKE